MTPSVYAFDASIGSLIAHLLDPYLTYPCTPFPHPLTTRDLSTPSSVRRFEVCSCKTTSRDLPSSLVQHRGATVDAYFYLIILDLTLTDFHLPTVCCGIYVLTNDYGKKEGYLLSLELAPSDFLNNSNFLLRYCDSGTL